MRRNTQEVVHIHHAQQIAVHTITTAVVQVVRHDHVCIAHAVQLAERERIGFNHLQYRVN